MTRRRALFAVISLLALVAVVAGALAAGNPLGSVKQVPGLKGCYTRLGTSQDGAGTCTDIRGGGAATDFILSPDGRNGYLVGYGSSPSHLPVLSAFKRDKTDGTLKQLSGKAGCLSSDGTAGDETGSCTDARNVGTGDGHSMAISKDGHFLYAASQGPEGGLAVFRRNPKTGALTQLPGKRGCFTADGSSEDGPGTCRAGRELDDTSSVHISADQRYLYATNYDGAPNGGIAIFKRNAKNGTLHQLDGKKGCVTQDGTTSDGGASVICRAAPGLAETFELVDVGRFVYAADRADSLVAALERAKDGSLSQLPGKSGCISDDGASAAGADTCKKGHGLYDAERVVVSKGSRYLYVEGYSDPTQIAVLDRNPKTGVLSERGGPSACLSVDGSSVDGAATCRNGRAIDGGYAGSRAPDGRSLYFAERHANAFVILRTDPETGAFSQLPGTVGCVSVDGSSEDGAGTCASGRAVNRTYEVTVARGGRDVYVVGESNAGESDGVALFHAKTK